MATFRRFRPDDLKRLSRCNLDAFTETYELGFYLHYHATWPSLFQVCEDAEGNIIGYIMGKVEETPAQFKDAPHYLPWHAHITALTVAPEARKLGVGKILTQQLESAADSHDAWFVDLFVRKSNTTAITVYERMGYSVWRVIKGYYGPNSGDPKGTAEDAYDMRKSMKRDKKREHVRENGRSHEVAAHEIL